MRPAFALRGSSGAQRTTPDDGILEHDSAWTIIQPRQPGAPMRLGEFWRYRHLLGYFGFRFLSKYYARTKLGWYWIPLRPVLEVSSRVLVFGSVLVVPSGGVPYLLFYLTGTSAWHMFQRYVLFSTRSFELNRKILSRMYFSRLVLPVAAIVPALVELLVYAVLILVAALWYLYADGTFYLRFGPETFMAIAGFALLAGLGFGIGLFTSVLGANARDLRFSLSYIMNFWFFLTPVIYSTDSMPSSLQFIADINPAAAPIEMVKYGLIGTPGIHDAAIWPSISVVVLASVCGLWFFARAEASSVDGL